MTEHWDNWQKPEKPEHRGRDKEGPAEGARGGPEREKKDDSRDDDER